MNDALANLIRKLYGIPDFKSSIRQPNRVDSSVMDGYVEPKKQSEYVNTEPPLEAPIFSPDDLLGTGIGKGMLAGGASLASLLGLMRGGNVPSKMYQTGATAYHGSPHKFDKFSLDKIGTGEGAQAYGHGLYLAENPSVAREYQERLGGFQPSEITSQFKKLIAGLPASAQKFLTESQAARTPIDQMKQKALQSKVQAASWDAQDVKNGLAPSRAEYVSAMDEVLAFLEKNALPKPPNPGQMYKTDIPDEAVARFLDWDKPLSQQSKEVRDAVAKLTSDNARFGQNTPRWNSVVPENATPFENVFDMSGYRDASGNVIASNRGTLQDALRSVQDSGKQFIESYPGGAAAAQKHLQELGIPGIRYLDGGSRSAGQGSSNFVAFDPDMIRILERNGMLTGQVPWKPGEWKPK